MKSHDLANAIMKLARAMKKAPNVEIGELQFASPSANKASIELNLATLVELSRIDKQQWISLIEEHGFPIKFRPRDASRDILGKLLRFLEKHPEARRQLKSRFRREGRQSSPELAKALETLLRDDS